MAPVFASPDIAALIAAFPPSSPAKDQPSLMRSRSGDCLLNSQKVAVRFRTLLQSSPDRISLRDLPRRLGIERLEWLFEYYESTIHYSKDEEDLIPLPEYEGVVDKLQSDAERKFVDVLSFTTEQDISLRSVEQVCDKSDVLKHFSKLSNPSTVYIGSQELTERLKEQIILNMSKAGAEKVNLSQLHADVPTLVLRIITNETVKDHESDLRGKIEDDGEILVFVPERYDVAQEAKQRNEYESIVQVLVQHLNSHGYCLITREHQYSDQLQMDVWSKFQDEGNLESPPRIVNADDGTKCIVLEHILNDIVGVMTSGVVRLATKDRRKGSSIDSSIQTSLIEESPLPQLTSILLQSEHIKSVETAYTDTITNLDAEDHKRLEQQFQVDLAAPVDLYAIGISTVEDTTLKEHLEEFLGDHFRREIIPRWVDSAKKQEVLHYRLIKDKEVERFLQSLTQTKTLTETQSLLIKFSKKQKMATPSEMQLDQVKQQTLTQNLKSIQRMKRGSDVLQNLIWILLAKSGDGLYQSSGKDTSRMIKQYQLIGDSEIAKKLQTWRDSLKAGDESEETLAEMIELARSTAEG